MRIKFRQAVRSVNGDVDISSAHDALDSFILVPNSSTCRSLLEAIASVTGDGSLLASAAELVTRTPNGGVSNFRQNGHRERLLKLADVEFMVALRKTTIYGLVEQKRFPAPVKIGKATRWRASEISQWVADRSRGGTGTA
jgi:prophage regulatory protein